MNSKLRSIEDLNNIVYRRWSELDNIDSKYVNEAGLAAKEAFRTVIWHLAFHDSLDSLEGSQEFRELVCIPNKHHEYYRVLRMINRAVERATSR